MLKDQADDRPGKQEAEDHHGRNQHQTDFERVLEGLAFFRFGLAGDRAGQHGQRGGADASRQQFRQGRNNLETVIQSRQRPGGKKGRDHSLHDHH